MSFDKQIIDEPEEINKLREWALIHQIEKNKLESLLQILRKNLLPQFPLKTQKHF